MNDQRHDESPQIASPVEHGDGFLVVGIGASAGGIPALQTFFANIAPDFGFAYVVILHLSPEHESRLAPILQTTCPIPVTQVTERVRVERNHVYVIAPDKHLSMIDGHIVVESNITIAERRAPVDIFFRTLAESHGALAVCVILSGTGANGSMGLKRIKECGGAAFVQDPGEAEWEEMPRNSMATGLVDQVLPVARIPEKIASYAAALNKVIVPLPNVRVPDEQSSLREIFLHLRARTGHDFSNYKRPTLLRRIERRIRVHDLPDIRSYAELVRERPDETMSLLKDILISVTHFFRDEAAFKFLEQDIIPKILAGKSSQNPLRIWTIGCATGEEAYSIAMLCAEQLPATVDPPKIQIFATDIDAGALSVAREGLYTLNDAADISAERLRRFFTKENRQYRIRREIREMILFANHNAIKDPPFSHLDLVSCRNVLIYLELRAQERLLETLHFALNAGGFLFLGSSESVGESADLFATVGRQQHTFQSRAVDVRQYPVAEKIATFQSRLQRPPAGPDEQRNETTRGTFGDLHQQLVEQYAPPSLVVNEDYEIVHLSSRAGRYLQLSGGEPSNSLLQLIRQELRLELRTALYQATTRKVNVKVPGVEVTIDGAIENLSLHVRPITGATDSARGFLLVIFEPTISDPPSEEPVFKSDAPVSQQLEEELIEVRHQLRNTNEAHEVQTEELKASNEELQAMNEELRSVAEELETSREELQSINEELTTVNQELNIKIEEVSQSGNNLRNLVNSSDIGTIFLDRGGRVHLFSPAAREIFNLQASDVGRELSDITTRLQGIDLLADASRVLDTLDRIEREVATTEGQIYLMRLLPYRTSDDRIQGVVATFTNITDRKHHEVEIAANLRDTQLLHDLSVRLVAQADTQQIHRDVVSTAVTLLNADGGMVHIVPPNASDLELLYAQGLDQTSVERFRRVDVKSPTPYGIALATQQRAHADFSASDRDPVLSIHAHAGYLSAQATPLICRSGRLIGMLSTHWKRLFRPDARELRFLDLLARQTADFLEQRQSSVALFASQERLQAITDLVPDLLWSNGPDGSTNWYNQRWVEYTGLHLDQSRGYGWLDAMHPGDREALRNSFQQSLDSGRPLQQAYRIRRADGEYRWFLVNARPLRDASGRILQWFGSAIDVHESRIAHEALERSEERLRLTFESVTDYAIFAMDLNGRIDSWNVGAERMFGFEESEAIGNMCDIIFTPEDRAAGAPQEEMRTAREHGRAADERFHVRKDGTRFYVSGVLTLLQSDGGLTGYAKIARDLTEQKRAGDALRQAHEELELKVDERTRELALANVSLREEMDERTISEDARLNLLQQLVNAQEAERRRISRELHDQLGQQVSALGLKLSMLKNEETLPAPMRVQIESLGEIARKIDGDLDFLVWELRPTALDDLGLVEALDDYIRSWSTHFAIPASFRAVGMKSGRLDPEMETVLYRIAQEGLNNVSKHASASQVDVLLERVPQRVMFTVRDNGVGFDPAQPFGTGEKGLGLVSMRERAALAGGSLDIESKPGAGAAIIVRLPLGEGGKRKTRGAGKKRTGA